VAEFGDQIDVRVRPAARSKGTDLAARLRDRASSGTALNRLSSTDPHSDLRSALCRAKQLIEVGEVLVADTASHGKRTATLAARSWRRGPRWRKAGAWKAVAWRGVNKIGVEDCPEPTILNDHEIVLEVGLSATCGSDLHQVGGCNPAMRAGDVLGHEFMGTAGRAAVPATSGCPVPIRGFAIPDNVSDELALFVSDAAPTGWTGHIRPRCDRVTESRCGVQASWPGGRTRGHAHGRRGVVVIDRYDNWLEQVRAHIGAEAFDSEKVDVPAELREMTDGREPESAARRLAWRLTHRAAVPLRPGEAADAAADRPSPGGA
jgi:hypothetical protein